MQYKSRIEVRRVAGLLTFLLAAGLTGCGKTEAEESAQIKAAQTEAVPAFTETEETEESEGGQEKEDEKEPAAMEQETQETVNESASMEKEQKTPPEGWELVFDSPEWGLSYGEPGTQPIGNASAEDLAWYDGYYVGSDSEKVLYLTFDCGYENGNTQPILDALKKHNAKATFFVVGHFLETAPDLVKQMTEDGHAVGNHTYHHPDMSSISTLEDFQKELDDVANLFREVTGEELAPYYRPPQGECNTENIKMAQQLGYATIFWSLAYVDWNQDD